MSAKREKVWFVAYRHPGNEQLYGDLVEMTQAQAEALEDALGQAGLGFEDVRFWEATGPVTFAGLNSRMQQAFGVRVTPKDWRPKEKL